MFGGAAGGSAAGAAFSGGIAASVLHRH